MSRPAPGDPRFNRFRALSHRNFRLFWSGQLVSLIGTWMQSVAQGWLMHRLTGSALMLGVLGFAQFLPVTRPATAPKQTMRTLAPMHAARRPKAARPYRRFKKFKIPPSAIAIPAPKNQTLALGVEERRNVVAIWKRPRARITAADKA